MITEAIKKSSSVSAAQANTKGCSNMAPESQFQHTQPKPKKRGRKRLRKNYDVMVLRDAKAKGRFRKGEGFNRGPKVRRRPIRGDVIFTDSEELIWLRAR